MMEAVEVLVKLLRLKNNDCSFCFQVAIVMYIMGAKIF